MQNSSHLQYKWSVLHTDYVLASLSLHYLQRQLSCEIPQAMQILHLTSTIDLAYNQPLLP